MRIRSAILSLTLLAALAPPSPARTCAIYADFKPFDIALADLVVGGVLIDYRLVQHQAEFRLGDYALMTFLVTRTFRGDALPGEKVTMVWMNSTFGMPEFWQRPHSMIVAARTWGSPMPPLRGPSATIAPSRRPDLPQVLQAPPAAHSSSPPTTSAIAPSND